MLRQLVFGIAAMACLSLCTAELQAQCVGCGASAPVYSTPISSAPVVYGAQQSYGVQSYGTPVESYAPVQSYAAPAVSYAAPVESYASPGVSLSLIHI